MRDRSNFARNVKSLKLRRDDRLPLLLKKPGEELSLRLNRSSMLRERRLKPESRWTQTIELMYHCRRGPILYLTLTRLLSNMMKRVMEWIGITAESSCKTTTCCRTLASRMLCRFLPTRMTVLLMSTIFLEILTVMTRAISLCSKTVKVTIRTSRATPPTLVVTCKTQKPVTLLRTTLARRCSASMTWMTVVRYPPPTALRSTTSIHMT